MTDDLKITLPSHVVGSGNLERLVRTARGYADAAASENTLKAYKADWMHFGRWCRMRGADPMPPSPELVGLYLADLASPSDKSPPSYRVQLNGACPVCAGTMLPVDKL
jgi:hypothetical protein